MKNRLSELKTLEVWLAAFAASEGLAPRTAFALDLVLNEALINSMSHGFEDDENHQISVCLEDSPTAVVADITDDGRPFDPLKAAPPQVASDLDSARLGGAAYI